MEMSKGRKGRSSEWDVLPSKKALLKELSERARRAETLREGLKRGP